MNCKTIKAVLPEPILLATEKLGVLPEEVVYIGDTESDCQAAQAAGTRFILYSKDPTTPNVIVASQFNELPSLITQLG